MKWGVGCSLTSLTHQTSKGLDRKEWKREFRGGGGCREDEESEVGGYPLIRSAPRSDPVSFHIHNTFLHPFQSLINKTVSFHPESKNQHF